MMTCDGRPVCMDCSTDDWVTIKAFANPRGPSCSATMSFRYALSALESISTDMTPSYHLLFKTSFSAAVWKSWMRSSMLTIWQA